MTLKMIALGGFALIAIIVLFVGLLIAEAVVAWLYSNFKPHSRRRERLPEKLSLDVAEPSSEPVPTFSDSTLQSAEDVAQAIRGECIAHDADGVAEMVHLVIPRTVSIDWVDVTDVVRRPLGGRAYLLFNIAWRDVNTNSSSVGTRMPLNSYTVMGLQLATGVDLPPFGVYEIGEVQKLPLLNARPMYFLYVRILRLLGWGAGEVMTLPNPGRGPTFAIAAPSLKPVRPLLTEPILQEIQDIAYWGLQANGRSLVCRLNRKHPKEHATSANGFSFRDWPNLLERFHRVADRLAIAVQRTAEKG